MKEPQIAYVDRPDGTIAVEITEFDPDGKTLRRTYGHVAEQATGEPIRRSGSSSAEMP